MMSTRLARQGQPSGPRPEEPAPGGHIPSDVPPLPQPEPDKIPVQELTGPRTPFPMDDPSINDPKGPGSEPDYLPGGLSDPRPRLWPSEPETKSCHPI